MPPIETKPFYRTSEWWLTVATIAAAVTGAIPIPDRYKGIVAAFVAAAYAISRGLAKQGVAATDGADAYAADVHDDLAERDPVA